MLIKVGIVGGTGYTGVELLRLLSQRDDIELCCVTSRELDGQTVCSRFPNLRGKVDLRFSNPDSSDLKNCEVVFFATPHAVAMHSVPELIEYGTKVIDLSADFRINDIKIWETWYQTSHTCPELVDMAVYGLPEVNRDDIKQAQLIAVPGCYPTAIQLGFLPLLEMNVVDTMSLIADAKSGVSGAGRKAADPYILCEATESLKAYGMAGHRHHPEICQQLNIASNSKVGLTFIPHLAPMSRGIFATLYAKPTGDESLSGHVLREIYQKRYAEEPFVDILETGEAPATRDVRGANNCKISVTHIEHSNTVVVLSVIDNLVKGASGQAVQCMNLLFGIDETRGLEGIALTP